VPRRKTHHPLNVFLNSRLVGTLRRAPGGAIDFQYARDWLEWDNTFSVSLSLPLREDRYVGAQVVNVFDNLLPDSDPIRRRVAERVGAEGTDAFSLLTAIGRDCVGALQFLPDGISPGIAGDIAGKPMTDAEVGDLVENLATAPLGVGPNEDFRISIAGAQEKTALLRHDGQWFKPAGSTATTHILKPQIGHLPNGIDLSNSVENEYLCLKLMSALGVPAASAEIADFSGRHTLVVERFDRSWTQDSRLLRLPQEDCCQALSIPPTRKYQSDGGPGMREIVNLLKGSDTPETDIGTFMRANILFWLLGATDGHAKNVSVLLGPGGRFRLTPTYDVLSAQPSLDGNMMLRRSFRLAMSVGKNRHYAIDQIMPHHFLQTANLAGVPTTVMRATFEELAHNTDRKVAEVTEALPPTFPEPLVQSVTAGITRRLRALTDFEVGGMALRSPQSQPPPQPR
jgi:serine/threonine-protein kinase HipA